MCQCVDYDVWLNSMRFAKMAGMLYEGCEGDEKDECESSMRSAEVRRCGEVTA